MGMPMNQCITVITAEDFASVVEIVKKRMSTKTVCALSHVEMISLLHNKDAWGECMTRTIQKSSENPFTICVTSLFDI